MSMVQPPIDELYWRAYSAAILKLITAGSPLGPGLKLYIAPPSLRGIAGGRFIPEAVTNNLLYNVADDLLPVNDPIYIPGGREKYTHQLAKYLNWVQVSNGVDNPEALKRLNETLERLMATQSDLDAKSRLAIDQYSKLADTDKISFEDWCLKFATYLIVARKTNLIAAEIYDAALTAYYGADAGFLIQCKDRLRLATDILTLIRGYNMSCTLADLSSIDTLWKESDDGQKPVTDNPTKLFYLPAFSMQGYRDTVDFWISNFGKNPIKIHIEMEDGKKVTWEQMGFPNVNLSRNSRDWYLFSITVGSPSNRNKAPVFKYLDLRGGPANDSTRRVSLDLIINGMQQFPVDPGAWDIPGVKDLFPNLREGANFNYALVRVQSLCLAYGVGLNATFSESTRDKVHTMLTEARETGGSARIFGIDVVSHPNPHTDHRPVTFDQVNWDRDSGSLVIPAVDDGFPVLLGVMGRQL